MEIRGTFCETIYLYGGLLSERRFHQSIKTTQRYVFRTAVSRQHDIRNGAQNVRILCCASDRQYRCFPKDLFRGLH